MPLNEYQRASFRNHIHSSDQVIDPETGDPLAGGIADGSGEPSGAPSGLPFYYDTEGDQLYGWVNGAWIPFSSAGGEAAPATDVDDTADPFTLASEGTADILDETFNYATFAALEASGWDVKKATGAQALLFPGNGIWIKSPSSDTSYGYGIEYPVGTGSLDVVVALEAPTDAVQDMLGIALLTAGVGEGFSDYYDGNGYYWNIGSGTPYWYASTGGTFGAQTNRRDGRRFCLGLKRNGTTHTYYVRNGNTGTWTTLGSRSSVTARSSLFVGRMHNNGNNAGHNSYMIRRVLIGTLGNLL